jgi:hypothetical protein
MTTSLKDELAAIIAAITEALDRARRYHAQQAEQHGYAVDLFGRLPRVVQEADEQTCRQLSPIFNKFRLFLDAREQSRVPWDVSSSAFAVSSTATAIVAPVKVEQLLKSFKPLNWSPGRSRLYADRLQKIEPETSKVYRSVSEAFWASVENPERAALYQMRQCFDQLFTHLAPDDAVRGSTFFQPKAPPKELQVYRRERILYAAHTHIKDKAQADYLAEQADTMLSLYEQSQDAHRRTPLDRDRTRLTLEGMMAALEQWIDALDAGNKRATGVG